MTSRTLMRPDPRLDGRGTRGGPSGRNGYGIPPSKSGPKPPLGPRPRPEPGMGPKGIPGKRPPGKPPMRGYGIPPSKTGPRPPQPSPAPPPIQTQPYPSARSLIRPIAVASPVSRVEGTIKKAPSPGYRV